MGGCAECPPTVGVGVPGCPLATVTIDVADLSTANPFIYSFGTFPAGKYLVRYCRGAWADTGKASPWTVNETSNTETGKSVDISLPTGIVDFVGNPSPDGYANQDAAEAAFACLRAKFNHDGGDISLRFMDDTPIYDDINGTPPIRFGLYKVNLGMRIASVCAVWQPGDVSAAVTINWVENDGVDWTGVVMKIDYPGGSITSSSFNVAAYGSGSTALVIPTTTPVVSLTITFQHSLSDDQAIPYMLSPLFGLESNFGSGDFAVFGPYTNAGICSGQKRYEIYFRARDLGNFQSGFAIYLTNDAGLTVCNSPIVTTELLCHAASYAQPAIQIRAPATPTTAHFTATVYDSKKGVLIGGFTFTQTIPS